MNFPTTTDILWGRLRGGLSGKDYSEWATGLIVQGIENEVIIDLAANPDLHWQDREPLVSRILDHLGATVPKTVEDLCLQIQNRLIGLYVDQQLDETQLVSQCYELWLKSDYSKELRIWGDLSEDISLCTTEYGPVFHHIEPQDINGSIRKILLEHGLIEH